MPLRLTRRLIILCCGTFLGCVILLMLSAFPAFSLVSCCGNGLGFPFWCLLIILAILCTSSWVFHFLSKHGEIVLLGSASKQRLQQFASLLFSEYLRGWFILSLFLSMAFVLVGAAFLFSLSFDFTWSALAAGCLSVLFGLAILGFGGRGPKR